MLMKDRAFLYVPDMALGQFFIAVLTHHLLGVNPKSQDY